MIADFDEESYLANNPDVAAAVAQGIFASGLEHFQAHGYHEGRRGGKTKKSMRFYIDVFSYCNLRCPSCIVGNDYTLKSEWRRGLMDLSLLERILDKATAEVEVSEIDLYNWTEPLLHPGICELIALVKGRNIRCSVSSNLNVLRAPEELLASGLDWLRVSVSGFTQAVYERAHRGGNIEAVKSNMKRLADAKKAVGAKTSFQVLYHLYRYNRAEMDLMSEFSRQNGFEFSSMLAYLTSVEKILALCSGDEAARTPDDRLVLENLVVPLETAIEITAKSDCRRCNLLEDMVTLDVAGNVMLCCGCSMSRQNVIGSFLDFPIGEIQERKSKHELCGPCMRQGIPNYFTGHPSFGRIADEVFAAG